MVTEDEAINIVKERLQSEWILVEGDALCISLLEETVYTPDTDENKNFEVLVLGFPPRMLVLAKKTERLTKLLADNGVSDNELQNLIGLILRPKPRPDGIDCSAYAISTKTKEDRPEIINKIVEKLKKIQNTTL